MKKTYIEPQLLVVGINAQHHLLTASDNTDPTQMKRLGGSYSGSSALSRGARFSGRNEEEW